MTEELSKIEELMALYSDAPYANAFLPGGLKVMCGELAAAMQPADWQTAATEAGWLNPAITSPGIVAAWCERHRQVSVEGYTSEQDDALVNGELAAAAVCYVLPLCKSLSAGSVAELQGLLWELDPEMLKPEGAQRALTKAAALLAAEADRLNRADLREQLGQL